MRRLRQGLLSRAPRAKTRGPRHYFWIYVADWDRDSWNGVSCTGTGRLEETHPLIRIRFESGRRPQRVGKRINGPPATKSILRAVLKYKRGLTRRRMLAYYSKALK